MKNKNKKISARLLLLIMLLSLSLVFAQGVAFAQEEPPEVEAPEFPSDGDGDGEEEPPEVEAPGFDGEPEAEDGEPEPEEEDETPPSLAMLPEDYPQPSPPGYEPVSDTDGGLSDTGPAVGFLLIPSYLAGWIYRKNKKDKWQK